MEVSIKESFQTKLAALHAACQRLLREDPTDGIFEKLAGLACELTSARLGALGLVTTNGDPVYYTSSGLSGKHLEEMLVSTTNTPEFTQKRQTGEVVRLSDLRGECFDEGQRRENGKKYSLLGVPISCGPERCGYLYLIKEDEEQEFTDESELLAETLAPYIGLAVNTVRRQGGLPAQPMNPEKRIENLLLVHQMAPELVINKEIDPILERVLQLVMDTLDFKKGEIFVKPENQRVFRKALHLGSLGAQMWIPNQFKIGEASIGQTAESGKPHFLDLSKGDDPNLNEEMLNLGIHQIVSFPIRNRDCVIGVLSFGTGFKRPLKIEEIEFINLVCNYTGAAIQNVRTGFIGRQKAVTAERERIGMDLHDGIIQSIYAVGLTLDHARLVMVENPEAARDRIQHAIDGLNGAIRDIRTYILDLRPRQLNNEDLMKGLQRLVKEFRTNTLVEAHLDGPMDGSTARIPPINSVALFHICQESLANAGKHARANRVDVNVWLTNERAVMEIRDDGRGFDVEKTTSSLGHGLSNIYTRARNVGGDVEISSESGFGTTVLCWVPLKTEEQ
ncbi:MAG: GAF domain-containing protein [Anaerolineaceae bacterium]